jgi:hypothetical protein
MIAEEGKRGDEFHFRNGRGVYPRVLFVRVASKGLTGLRVK